MPDRLIIHVNASDAGERLDKVLVGHLGDRLTRSQIQNLIRDGAVRVNDAPTKAGWRMQGGETVALEMPEPAQDPAVIPMPIALDVLYEDRDIGVINKPAGMVVHPGAGNPNGTLVNAILARYPEIASMTYAPRRRGIVHRLDKDTSGVIVVARSERVLHGLMTQFQKRTVEKIYLALVNPAPKTRIGRIDAPIDRSGADRKKMAVQRSGRPAISEFEVEQEFSDGSALVRIRLLTGRTHQIRVHMAFIGSPIVGDRLYGHRRQRLPVARQFLHASILGFDHPATGARMRFEAPLPADLSAVLAFLTGEKH
jgi:23S rRNA pseudouridine1911/1915/1917 synthase